MLEKELIIKVRLDPTHAKADSQEVVAAQKQAEKQIRDDLKASEAVKRQLARETADAKKQADKEAAEAIRKAARDTLIAQKQADREALQSQKQWLHDASVVRKQMDQHARESAQARVQETRDAQTQIGKSSAAMIGMTTTLAQEALQQVKQFVSQVASAIKTAEQAARQMTAEFGDQRDRLAHLAGLEGRQANNAYTLEFAQFNKRTGLTAQESLASQEAFLNSGMQYKGKTISDTEHTQFREQQAKLAVARQIEPSVVADLAGRTLGTKDYKKFGEQASEQALGDLNQMLAVLSSGTGEDAQLVRETTKVMASQTNEDELRGTLKSGKDAAKLVSVMTEGYPEGQAEAVNAMLRTQRGFEKKKGGKFLKEAGVTPEDDPFTANKKIGRLAEKMAKAGPAGTNVQDILRENFEEELGARAIAVAYNKGTTGGLFEARDVTAGENAGPESAMSQIKDAEATERVQRRMADADVRAAELERGAENSKLEIYRKQSLARLIREKRISTSATNIGDYIKDKASFGMLGDPEQRRIDEEVARSLGIKDKGWLEGGNEALGGKRFTPDIGKMLPEDRARFLNERIAGMEGNEGNRIPMAGQAGMAPAAGAPVAPGGDAAKDLKDAAKDLKDAAKEGKPLAPAPLPVKAPAPVMRVG